MPNLLGSAPNQCPTNGDLGKLAFMDVVDTVTNNPYVDTAISDTKPSLLLDFANSKTLDPRITYTRASTASYYDGKTTAVAEQNLLTYSQDFSNSLWAISNVTKSANATTAPDGTSTASSIVSTATGALVGFFNNYSLGTASQPLTISIYAKANTTNFIQLYISGSILSAGYANFNITAGAGAVGSINGTGLTAAINDAGNGWYRCSVTIASISAGAVGACQVLLVDSATSTRGSNYTGTVGNGVYIWGAQVEQRASLTAYTPTTSSPITNYIPALQTAAAGVPRFDHDPVTGESKGFLIEEQRSNLVTYSTDFSNAAWGKINTTVTADSIVAPDGSLTGDKLVENTSNGLHYINNVYNAVAKVNSPTVSFYCKSGGRSKFYVSLIPTSPNDFSNDAKAYFDLSAESIYNTTRCSANIVAVGNGWYRCSVSPTQFGSSASTTMQLVVFMLNGAGSETYTGDGYSGIYIWGAQLEAGSFATSYIPTTSAQVTRSADAASMTGTNFSSWFNGAEGTTYIEVLTSGTPVSGVANRQLLNISNGASSNLFSLNWNVTANKLRSTYVSNSTTVASFDSNLTLLANNNYKINAAYKNDAFATVVGGDSIVVDASGAVPVSMTQLDIGRGYSGGELLCGYIKKLAYYPKRLSDAELQEMTQ